MHDSVLYAFVTQAVQKIEASKRPTVQLLNACSLDYSLQCGVRNGIDMLFNMLNTCRQTHLQERWVLQIRPKQPRKYKATSKISQALTAIELACRPVHQSEASGFSVRSLPPAEGSDAAEIPSKIVTQVETLHTVCTVKMDAVSILRKSSELKQGHSHEPKPQSQSISLIDQFAADLGFQWYSPVEHSSDDDEHPIELGDNDVLSFNQLCLHTSKLRLFAGTNFTLAQVHTLLEEWERVVCT